MPRLDAIVYRTGGASPDYLSEHASSSARDANFHRSLSKLSSIVKADIDTGLYIPHSFEYVRPFVTCIHTTLELRNGMHRQTFLSCAYEVFGHRGHPEFFAMCPTNYLSNMGDSLIGSFSALGEVIQSRYHGETVTDLMRELPKTPLVTTFALEQVERPETVGATITHDGKDFWAYAQGTSLSAKGHDPYGALRSLECALLKSNVDMREHVLRDEPIFGSADVRLYLQESAPVKRFLIAVAPCRNGSKFYRAYAPQAGVTTTSSSIDGALQNIKDAIALQFHESSLMGVEKALSIKPIMTTARLNCN
jgi:hypothetical protein